INIEGVGHVISPTLKQIEELGQDKYFGYINILTMTPEKYCELTGTKNIYESLSEEDRTSLKMFNLWIKNPDCLNIILKALSFFIVDKIDFSNEAFILSNFKTHEVYGKIDVDNFNDICKIILQLNFIKTSEIDNATPKNGTVKYILEKLKKGAEIQNKKLDKDITMDNIIPAMCVQHNSYNTSNIWSLTVYQLYELFFRQNSKNQVDVSAILWAARGTEEFDFSRWFKSNK
ncbi:MAG: hypothetical protein RR263_03560, partial [Oscillospiraceae bacterium]